LVNVSIGEAIIIDVIEQRRPERASEMLLVLAPVETGTTHRGSARWRRPRDRPTNLN